MMDYLDFITIEAKIKKLVRVANDPRIVAFPLRLRKPWRNGRPERKIVSSSRNDLPPAA